MEDPQDKESLLEMYKHDQEILLEIADYIDSNKDTEAYELAMSLDTALRESIPDNVWEYLEKSQIET